MVKEWFATEFVDSVGNRQRLNVKWDESIEQFTVTHSELQALGNGPDSSTIWALSPEEAKRLVLVLDQD